jgi:hypothetical protein
MSSSLKNRVLLFVPVARNPPGAAQLDPAFHYSQMSNRQADMTIWA